MALWASDSGIVTTDTDMTTFYWTDLNNQPKGRSILTGYDYKVPVPTNVDWSRIVAVVVDEPYQALRGRTAPCPTNSQEAQDTLDAIRAKDRALADAAAELKAVAPLTRFWVNLEHGNLAWMQACKLADPDHPIINHSYVDVISFDVYLQPFSALWSDYQWLIDNHAKDDQQLALIPGTFYYPESAADEPGAVSTQAGLLKKYFDYADYQNQSCDLPWGSRGRTGSFDGCRVWIVMGWLAGNFFGDGHLHVGEQGPPEIASFWNAKRALPLRPDLAHQVTRGQLVPTILSVMED